MHISIKRVSWVIFLALVTIGFAFAGGSPAPETQPVASDYPKTFVDDLGKSLTLEEKPASVISVALFSDEVLSGLVPLDRLSAVTRIGTDPVYSNVADLLQSVEPVIEFSAEQIIQIYPDLVIAADWSEAEPLALISQAGIPVFQVATPTSLDEIRQAILRIGEVLGEQASAASLIASMDDRIADLRAITSAIPQDERVSSIDYSPWGTANGPDTTWSIVLDLAGIDNAAAVLEAGDFGQIPLSKEAVVELNPDIIFLPGYIWGEEGGAEAFLNQILEDPAFQGLQAIESGRVISFPENLKGSYSQFLVDAAELAARLAYPDRF